MREFVALAGLTKSPDPTMTFWRGLCRVDVLDDAEMLAGAVFELDDLEWVFSLGGDVRSKGWGRRLLPAGFLGFWASFPLVAFNAVGVESLAEPSAWLPSVCSDDPLCFDSSEEFVCCNEARPGCALLAWCAMYYPLKERRPMLAHKPSGYESLRAAT